MAKKTNLNKKHLIKWEAAVNMGTKNCKYSIAEECPICHELTGELFEHDNKEYAHVKRGVLMRQTCKNCYQQLVDNKETLCVVIPDDGSDMKCAIFDDAIIKKYAEISNQKLYLKHKMLFVSCEFMNKLKQKQREKNKKVIKRKK
jgi:hypothetical protein